MKTNSEERIENQNFVQEIDCQRRSSWIFLLQVNPWRVRKRLKVFNCLLVSDKAGILVCRISNNIENNCQLVISWKRETIFLYCIFFGWRQWETTLSREQWFSVHECWWVFFHHSKKLSKDTTYCPNVNCRSIIFLKQNDFRSSIPSCNNVSSEFSFDVLSLISSLY